MTESLEQQKTHIRQHIRQVRSQITGQTATKAGQSLCQNLSLQSYYAAAQNIACYQTFDGEIASQPIIEMVVKEKGHCFLPKIRPNKPNRLWFMPYQNNSPLTKNRFGICEVDLPVNRALAASKLDLILMPLVAFDQRGDRLGMGGGFYDATLAHLFSSDFSEKKRPRLIGLAYQQQLVEQIPQQSWDIRLDGVLTEQNAYQF